VRCIDGSTIDGIVNTHYGESRRKLRPLATLWFVVLFYIQTGSGGDGAVNMAIGVIAILLMYILPLSLVIFVILQLIDR
jgi:hypothetical protein